MDPGHLNPPDSNEQIRAIKSVVKNNGFGKATILSHSNGTLNHGTLVRKAPEICGKHVLTDPVSWKKLWGEWKSEEKLRFVLTLAVFLFEGMLPSLGRSNCLFFHCSSCEFLFF